MAKEQKVRSDVVSDLDAALCREILRMRKETLEINDLLSKPHLTASDLILLKKLFLQDANDGSEELSSAEWYEILRTRVVICPEEKRLSVLANMLCMA